MADAVVWSELPEDVKEVVVSKLPLVDLARVSSLSRTSQALFQKELARQQKPCCEFAIGRMGRERIIRITSLISHYLKGESLEPYLSDTAPLDWVWVCADGTVQGDRPKCGRRASQIERLGWLGAAVFLGRSFTSWQCNVCVYHGNRAT
jgi:hypothetical protein